MNDPKERLNERWELFSPTLPLVSILRHPVRHQTTGSKTLSQMIEALMTDANRQTAGGHSGSARLGAGSDLLLQQTPDHLCKFTIDTTCVAMTNGTGGFARVRN